MSLRLAPPLPPEPASEPAHVPDDFDHEFFRTSSLAPVELDALDDDDADADAQNKSRHALRLGLSILGATGAALGGVILCLHLLIPTAADFEATTASLPGLPPTAAGSNTTDSPKAAAPTSPSREPVVQAAPAPSALPGPTAVPATPALSPAADDPRPRAAPARTPNTAPIAAGSVEGRVKAAFRSLSRGDFNLAVAQARRVVDSDPTRADAWLVLGSAYDQLHDTQSAKLAFRACAYRGKGSQVSTCATLAR